MFTGTDISVIPQFNYLTLACLFAMVGIGYWMAVGRRWRRLLETIPPTARGVGYSTMAVLALALAPGLAKTFIYFQF